MCVVLKYTHVVMRIVYIRDQGEAVLRCPMYSGYVYICQGTVCMVYELQSDMYTNRK